MLINEKGIQIASKTIRVPSLMRIFSWCPQGISPLRRRDFVPAGTTKGRSPSGGFALALWKPSPDRSSYFMVTQRWQVAAALSAAVTTTDLQETALQLAWAHKSEGRVKLIPSRSSEEGGWGRGASLREAASPPEFPQALLFGRGSGGGERQP